MELCLFKKKKRTWCMVEAFVQSSTSVLFSFLPLSMCFHLPGRNELASVPTSFSAKPAWILQRQTGLRSLIHTELSAFLWNKVVSYFIITQLLLLLISSFYESVLPDLFHFLQCCDCEYAGRPAITYQKNNMGE